MSWLDTLKGIFGERDRMGNVWYYGSELDGLKRSKSYLNLSFENFVLMTICALRSKIYSQMQITHLDSAGNEIKDSQYIKLLQQPNYFQSQEDFFFTQMWFLSATGNDYCYEVKSGKDPASLYNLIPSEIDFKDTNKLKKFITQQADIKAYEEKVIVYTLDGQDYKLPLKDIIPFYDLSNGMSKNSPMQSHSRVEGIDHVLQNINENVKSKNINLRFSQKYIISSQSDGNEVQLQEEDRKDITRKLGQKSVIITNQKILATHLVSDFKKLFLDEQLSNDALFCLLAFDMNKDVLNYFSSGSTYENQEKAMLNYIQNSIQRDADNTMNSFASHWGLIEKGEKLKASFMHLPIMQIIINQKIATLKAFQDVLTVAINNQTMTAIEGKKQYDLLYKKLGL
jgi:ribosomal protein S18